MRSICRCTRLAVVALGCCLVLTPTAGIAQDLRGQTGAADSERAPAPAPRTSAETRAIRGFAPPQKLDEADEVAALEAIRVALSEVGDGGSYVWYRENGHLNGVVNPTSSFKDRSGRVCRHIVLIMSAGARTGKVEGIACRGPDGRWLLEG